MTETASGYERQDLEKYFTPDWVTEALLSAVDLPGPIWDPAAGAGDMVRPLAAVGRAYGSDISPDAAHLIAADFFATDGRFGTAPPPTSIVTNPPFGNGGRLAVAFIKRALDLTKPELGKVAMLLRVDFDSAAGRRPLFADHPAFAAKLILTRRIRWSNVQQYAAGPTQNHAWYVWDWAKAPSMSPVIVYLPLRSAA